MLEKHSSVQKKKSKQHELSGHCKSIKRLFLKKTDRDDAKKRKRLTRIQVLKKDFTSQKIRCKSSPNQLSLLIYDQINLIKFAESKKFDNITVKFETFLFDQLLKNKMCPYSSK